MQRIPERGGHNTTLIYLDMNHKRTYNLLA